MPELSSDTKQAFGRMLVFLKTAQTADHTIYPFLTYADTLIVWTEAGLKTLGRYEKHAATFEKAKRYYRDAMVKLAIPDQSHHGWQHAEIIRLTFEINILIFPIALMEGVLVLNQEMINVTSMMMSSPEE